MKELEKESKIFIISIPISISLIVIFTPISYIFLWGPFGWLFLISFYQGIPILIAFCKTEREEKEFKEKRTDRKVFIAKRLVIIRSLEILSISYSVFFGLFFLYYFGTTSPESRTMFFGSISIILFGINFLISIYALVKFQYLTSNLIYPEDLIEKLNPSEDISEDLLRYLNLLRTPYFIREFIKYNLYLHFITLLPFTLIFGF